LGGFVKWLWE